jgi:hypothetical protein
MFDVHGPEAGLRIRAFSYGAMVMGLVTVALVFTAAQTGHISLAAVLGAVVAGAIFGALTGYIGLAFGGAAGAVAKAFTFPSGATTPYEEQFSYQEALAAKGDVAGALESYEAIVAERPGAVAPRMRAAELYAQRGRNPRRAAELFREIRGIPGASSREVVYAASRLVDLYDGALSEPGRALVELRRIIEQHPGTPVAQHARDALPRLKARLAAEQAALGTGPS